MEGKEVRKVTDSVGDWWLEGLRRKKETDKGRRE